MTLICALTILTGACSLVAGSDESSSADIGASDGEQAAPAEQAGPEAEAEAEVEVDCDGLFIHRQVYVQISGLMGVAEDPEPLSILSSSDFDAAEAAVEAFRPYQDVEPEVFGPLREGLDNMTADLPPARDGTFSGASGSYKSVSIIPVLEALGC